MPDQRWIDELAYRQRPGHEFEKLVGQLASKETGQSVHIYPSKDGGIDVYAADCGWGWQCKFIATLKGDVNAKASAVVKEAFGKLADHLKDNRPTTGQAQFDIWYEKGAVKRYTLATNLRLPNASSRKRVIKSIKDWFQNLKNMQGLSHLKDTEVCVWDAQDIEALLGKYPAIQLREFGTQLPQGVEYFQTWKSKRIGSEHDSNPRSFRAYLFEAALPYQPHPDEAKRPNPIWRRIEASETPLFVVYGRAGLGKSRLAVEIAELATIDSWLVFVLAATTTTDHILSEISQKYATHKCLFFVDYAENCASLQNLLSCLERLKEKRGQDKNDRHSAVVTFVRRTDSGRGWVRNHRTRIVIWRKFRNHERHSRSQVARP